jgi:hypothetical protein
MSLVDKIEELGAAIDAGQIGRDEAALQLQQYSDGGLTRLGAVDALAKWRTVRAQVADTRMSAELGLAAAEADLRRRDENPEPC